MSVRPRDRFLTFRRDSFKCQYCGRTPPEITLECDHVVARANGGSDDVGNLITACRECNIGKRTTDVVPPKTDPLFICDGCGIDLYQEDDFEGWDSDTFCRKCVEEWWAVADANRHSRTS